ncbi:DedA family protein [Gandjariella thermophila]|nr:DedA family protein [Gandjariella thermophila]
MVWVIVLTFVFAECAFIIGLFLPGDSLLFTAGLVLAQQHEPEHAWSLCVVATVVATVGNQLGYYIGRHTGDRMLAARRGGRVLNRRNLERARRFLNRKGFLAVVLARWIPWVRTLAPMIAGAAGMHPRRYLAATSVGAVVWVPSLVLIGYYGAGLLSRLPWLETATLVISVTFFVVGTTVGVLRYRQEMRRPVEQDEPQPAGVPD